MPSCIANDLSLRKPSFERGRRNRKPRMRYYFYFMDGVTTLDHEGLEFADLASVKSEAVETCVDLFKGKVSHEFWDGEPLRLWVTDQPGGTGETVLTLMFTST